MPRRRWFGAVKYVQCKGKTTIGERCTMHAPDGLCWHHGGPRPERDRSEILAKMRKEAAQNHKERTRVEAYRTVEVARRLGIPANEAFALVHFFRWGPGSELFRA